MMKTRKIIYTLYRYHDSKPLGKARLTPEEFDHYQDMAQMPQGLVKLGDLPQSYYDLKERYQDAHEDTTVYIGR